MFMEVVDKLIPEKTGRFNLKDDEIEPINQLLLNQRTANLMNNPELKNNLNIPNQNIPPELKRN